MEFEEFILEQNERFKLLKELDLACKKKHQFIGRFVFNGFAGRQAVYLIVDETPQKYLLRFVLGESPNPNWGREIKLYKNKVEKMIRGRDKIEKIFPIRN